MIKYRLIINPFAEQDLEEASSWYDSEKENLSIEFITEVDKVLLRITHNPFQFPVIKNNIRKALVNRFPFTIFFYVDKDIVNVFAVFHTYRNPIIWKKRFNK